MIHRLNASILAIIVLALISELQAATQQRSGSSCAASGTAHHRRLLTDANLYRQTHESRKSLPTFCLTCDDFSSKNDLLRAVWAYSIRAIFGGLKFRTSNLVTHGSLDTVIKFYLKISQLMAVSSSGTVEYNMAKHTSIEQ